MQRAVLIVEDTESCASILEIVLSTIDGIRTITARNAESAWELLNRDSEGIRAIVTDLQMPGMDGFELIDRVRAHGQHGRLPIIVITACTDPAIPELARARGVDALFGKPYSPARVREKLEQLLNDDTQSC